MSIDQFSLVVSFILFHLPVHLYLSVLFINILLFTDISLFSVFHLYVVWRYFIRNRNTLLCSHFCTLSACLLLSISRKNKGAAFMASFACEKNSFLFSYYFYNYFICFVLFLFDYLVPFGVYGIKLEQKEAKG